MLEEFLSSGLSAFKSWKAADGRSPQGQFLKAAAKTKTRIFRSGNRVGKTEVGAWDVAADCLGWHPWSQNKPPVHWWVSGLDWEFGIGQILWPKLKKYIPEDKIRSVAWMRRGEPEIPISVILKNGSQIDFKSADSGRKKYQGANLQGIWFDEEHPPDVVEEGRARLLNTNGYLNVTLTPLMRMRWVLDLEKEDDAMTFRASMIEAAEGGIIPMKAVKKYARSLPEKQRKVRVYGDFAALEGQVYPELMRETHGARYDRKSKSLVLNGKIVCPWPIPKDWKRFASADWGYVNPSVIQIAAEDPRSGRLIIYKCYYAAGIRGSVWGELLAERLPELRVPLICDHDAQVRAEIEAEGISTVPADKEIDKGLECVERITKQTLSDDLPKVVFVLDEDDNDKVLGRCDTEKIFWEAEHYHYPKVKEDRPDPKDRPVKKDDHAMDALRYLLVSWETMRGGPPLPPTFDLDNDDDEGYDDGYSLNAGW